MKIKTSELTGAALDWAVAKCEGCEVGGFVFTCGAAYSTDWAQCGPIIEREYMLLQPSFNMLWRSNVTGLGNDKHRQCGPTPLIAAMRCYVSSKLGDEVEVPDELTGKGE